MRVNCRWKDKFSKYGERVLRSIFPLLEDVNNTYVISSMLQNIKSWRPTEIYSGNQLADKLLSCNSLYPEDSLKLLEYGLRTNNATYTEKIIQNWNNIGFMFSEDDINKMRKLLTKDNKSLENIFMQSLNPKWKNEKFKQYLTNPLIDYLEISQNSKVISIDINDTQIIYYGITNQEESFSNLLEVIEKHKIINFALPLQSTIPHVSEEQIQQILLNKLQEKKKYKLIDVHNYIVFNIFGVKTIHLPLSLLQKNLGNNYFLYYPNIQKISELWDDYAEIEKLVRISMLINYCKLFDEIDSNGCYLCNKYKNYPLAYQDHAIYSAPFLDDFLKCIGNTLNSFINEVKNPLLVLCPQRLLMPIIFNS